MSPRISRLCIKVNTNCDIYLWFPWLDLVFCVVDLSSVTKEVISFTEQRFLMRTAGQQDTESESQCGELCEVCQSPPPTLGAGLS